jgi:flagellar hook-length control protein FliK
VAAPPGSSRASVKRTPGAASADPADRAEMIERIVRVVKRRIERERSLTVLRLDPPEMGMLKLRMELRKEALLLRIEAGSELAQRLLREDVDALRAGLEAAGIRLERLEIGSLAPPQDRHSDEPGFGGAFGSFSDGSSTPHQGRSTADDMEGRDPAAGGGGMASAPATESLVNIIA